MHNVALISQNNGHFMHCFRVMVQRFSPELDPLRPVEQIYKDTIGFFIAAFTKID